MLKNSVQSVFISRLTPPFEVVCPRNVCVWLCVVNAHILNSTSHKTYKSYMRIDYIFSV